MRWIGVAGAALALASLLSAGASAEEQAPAAEGQPAAVSRTRRPRRPVRRRSPAQAIEERVRMFTQALNLDAAQQARLRELLASERRQLRDVSADPAVSDRAGATWSVLERTRGQIRAMLNEEQKKKYPASVPHAETSAGHADVEYWLRLQQKPPQDAGEAH